MGRTAIIIGAGPAGLTAAYELLTRTDVVPLVLERTDYMGGISRTVNYKGNRIDIGGHRFFSKSDRVVQWWLQRLALEHSNGSKLHLTYQNQSRDLQASGLADPQIDGSRDADPEPEKPHLLPAVDSSTIRCRSRWTR